MKRRISFFDDLSSRSKYMGLQGVTGITGGYNWLQRITRGYKGLQGLTKDYRGLQRITETFFLARTSLDTLSWFILHKNQS